MKLNTYKIIGLTIIGALTCWTVVVPIICAILIWDTYGSEK